MSTKEAFAKHNVDLEWGKSKVVLYVGKERHKIVCSPEAFRWLKRLVENNTKIDPEVEAEREQADNRRLRSLRRKDNAPEPEPEHDRFAPVGVPLWRGDDDRDYPFAQPDYSE
jgi:hypothetical protein